MKASKLRSIYSPLLIATTALACVALTQTVRANNWIGGAGYWNDPANWDNGVPDNTTAWAIGGIFNGGTAWVTNTVPDVSEAWAGNGGVAGHIIVTNGGTLNVDNWLVMARMYESASVTPFSSVTIHDGVVNKGGDGLIVGDYYFDPVNQIGMASEGLLTVAGNGLLNVTGGWFGIGNGDGSKGTFRLRDNAVAITSGRDFNVGDYGDSRGYCYLEGNARLEVSRLWIGKGGATVGALWQNGGAFVGAGGDATEWCIGGTGNGDPNAMGFYHLASGSFINPFNIHIGRWGKGLFYQKGGTVTLGGWSAVGREAGGRGVVYITGGEFSHTNTTGPALMVAEQPSQGELTLAGTGTLTCANRLVIGNGGTAYFNLNGGALRVPQIVRWNGQSFLNLNGGTVQATAPSTTFLQGLTEARVFAGNAIFDTAGYDITVNQALLEGGSGGIVSIPITDGGSGYTAPPIVDISGDGVGALAVAEIDPVTGAVTNIVVTCPGSYYNGATAVLTGGGTLTPATLGDPVLGNQGGGGLIKNGAGTLTLGGANQYIGPTVVNAGKLIVPSDSIGMGSYTISGGTGLGIKVTQAGAPLVVASLALNGSANTLDFDLGGFGNPSSAPLSVTGNLAVEGMVTVNVATTLPSVGKFALVQYTGNRTGAGTFVLGPLPTGIQGSLIDSPGEKTVYLDITSVGLPRWEGLASGLWDVDTTANWIEQSNGQQTTFKNGAPALFNDSALGTTTVELVGNLQPAGVTVTNTTLEYTFVGAGKLIGANGLTKQGPGNLTIANSGGNEYTGPTVISGGTLTVTNLANGGLPSPIGKSSAAAANLVFAGGLLNYAGPAGTTDRGYTVNGPGSGITTDTALTLGGPVNAPPGLGGNFAKRGTGRLTYTGTGLRELSAGTWPGYNIVAGTLVFDGSAGGQTNHNQSDFFVGGTPDSGADLLMTNNAVLNVDAWFAIARGNGTIGNRSTATLYDSAINCANFSMGWDDNIFGNVSHSVLTLNGTSTVTNRGDVNMGESGGSTSELLLNGQSKFFTDWRMHVGWHTGGAGSVTVSDSAELIVDAWFSAGHEGGTGTLTVEDNGKAWILWDLNITDVGLGDGTMNVRDNAQISFNNCFIGKGTNSTALVTQSGGSLLGRDGGNEVHIGFHGAAVWNLTGGAIQADNHWFIVGRWTDGPGTFNVSGGTVRHTPRETWKLFRVGEDGTGVLNLSGTGSIETTGDAVTVGLNATGDGTINLNGGSFQARRIIGGNGLSTFNFNGGVLRVGANPNPDFMSGLGSANVLNGGAVIDTAGNNVSIAQELLAGAGNGGLTKLGAGALYLNAGNSYIGPTLVNAGTLGGSGSISGPVTVSQNGTLAPGTSIGTLTVLNTVTLNGTTLMEISKDGGVLASDLAVVAGQLAYGGTLNVVLIGTNALAVNDSFNLFDWATRSGSFTTVNLPSGYQWDTTQLEVDGTIRVSAIVAEPEINPPTISDGNLILTGIGGVPGGSYTWLTSTNVAAPIAQWTTNSVGTFDATGAFSNNIPVSTTEASRVFLMRVP